MKIEFDSNNYKKALSMLDGLNTKSQQSIMIKSVNDTARGLLKHVQDEMPKYIDRPKKITLNSMYVRFASLKKDTVDAALEFRQYLGKKQLKRHWLYSLVFGGERRDKGLDVVLKANGILPNGYMAVPTKDIRTDGYGNVPGSYVTRMVSFLKLDLSNTQNRTKKSKANKSSTRWFVVRPNGQTRIRPGIYEASSFRSVRMVYMFLRVSYKPSFPLFDISRAYVSENLFKNLSERIKKQANGGT